MAENLEKYLHNAFKGDNAIDFDSLQSPNPSHGVDFSKITDPFEAHFYRTMIKSVHKKYQETLDFNAEQIKSAFKEYNLRPGFLRALGELRINLNQANFQNLSSWNGFW